MFDVPAALAALRAGDESAAEALRNHYSYLIKSAPAAKRGAYFVALADCIRRLGTNRRVPGDAVTNFIEAELWRADRDFGREQSPHISAPASTKSSRRSAFIARLRRAIDASGESYAEIAAGASVPLAALQCERGVPFEQLRALAAFLGVPNAPAGKLTRRRHKADHAHDERSEYIEQRGHLNTTPKHPVTATDEAGEHYVPSRLLDSIPADDLRETLCRTPDEREVFHAMEAGHTSRREIAAASGISEATVRAILTRFRERASND